MLPCRFLTTLALITCIINVRSQYFDFIQGIQALIQPYQAQNPFYAQTTKRPQTTQKKNHEDVIVFQDDSRKKTTTSRPRKITNKNVQEIGRKILPNFESTTQIYNIKRIQNDFPSAITFTDQDRRIETNFNGQSTRNPIQENKKHTNSFSRPQKINTGFDNKPQKHKTQENFQSATQKYVTTHKPGHSNHVINTTPMYNTNQLYSKNQNYNENRNQETNTNNKNTAYNQYTSNNQGYTTNNQGYTQYNQGYTSNNQGNPRNPLVNQPGVKPANVDENQPPITNSPITDSIINFPDVANDEFEPPIEIGPNEENMSRSEKRRYVEIAEEVCNEYKARNVKKVVALPLSPSSQGRAVNVSDCTPINIPLILGGTVVSSIKEFPHMALVGWRLILGGYSWKCGGSLLSSQFILTAGHCTFQEKDNNAVSGPPQAVQLGSAVMDDPRATVVQVASVIRHPKYKRRRVYHDVALIKLVQEVVFSEMIRPACLGRPPGVDEPIIATGWGRTEFGGAQSRELRSVSLPIWNMDECREVWGTSRKLPNGPMNDDQICAGEKSGGKDTCQGDSGGPAQVQDGCVWRVVAVTSYGRSCGAPLTPALYARIPIPFVAAKVYEDRFKQTTNRLQNNYGTTAGYDGYQNDGNPNYDENQGYHPNNNQNQQNINTQNQYDRNIPIYESTQNNNNQNGYTQSFNQNDRVSPTYNQQQPNYNRENYGNQNVNQPNKFNTQPAQYINPSYEIPDYNRNQPKYGNQQYYGNQQNEPNYGFDPNYSVQVNRPWWTK